jgi:hypothetical protein
VEVEVSWVEGGRGVRERVDLFRFKEMVREAGRRGLPVALASGYAHRREGADPALQEGASPPTQPDSRSASRASGAERGAEAPKEEGGEGFDLLGLVRSLLRQEQESLGPAYG